jgi:ribosomal protein L16 Arg81 hydroxylase
VSDLLERLLQPLGLDAWLREAFQQRWVHLPGDPARLPDLPDVADVERILAERDLRPGDVTVVDAAAGGAVPSERWTHPSGLADIASLAALHADGATIVLNQAHLLDGRLAALVRSVEAGLHLRAQTNLYLTPAGAQGLGTHYDAHDVLAVQVAGQKRWTLYDRAVEVPLRAQAFDASNPPTLGPAEVVVTTPGDVLSLPSGWLHDAASGAEEPSLHVTLGLLPTTVLDLVATALHVLAERDPALRRALPPGWLQGSPGIGEAAEVLGALASEEVLAEAADRLAEDLVSTRRAVLPGQLRQAAQAVTPASPVRARADLLALVRRSGDEVRIDAQGRRLTLPARTEAAVRTLLDGAVQHAGHLPGLDDADGVALVARLVREGLVELLPG